MSTDHDWMPEGEGSNDALMGQIKGLIMHPFGILRRRWIWMLLTLVLGTFGSAAIYVTAKPIYLAKATVLVSSQQIPEDFVRSTVTGLDSLSNINALVGEVLSQRSLGELIDKYGLYERLRDDQSLSSLTAMMRSAIRIAPQRNFKKAQRGESSMIFMITYESTDPLAAAGVANDLSARFIDASIEKRSAQARTTTEFLRRELDRAEAALHEANSKVTQFQRERRGALPADLESMLRKLERLELQRGRDEDRVSVATERLIQLQNDEGIQSNQDLRLSELRLQLATQLAVHTPEHPNVIALRRQIDRMENEVGELSQLLEETSESADDRIAATRREIASLQADIAKTVGEMAELDRRVDQVPDNKEALDALNQRIGVLRQNYLEFLHKVQDAELAETLESAQQGPRVVVLDRAQPPRDPISSRYRKSMMSMIATLGLVGLVGLGLEILDPVVVSPEHFECIGSAPLLGSVYKAS